MGVDENQRLSLDAKAAVFLGVAVAAAEVKPRYRADKRKRKVNALMSFGHALMHVILRGLG